MTREQEDNEEITMDVIELNKLKSTNPCIQKLRLT